VRRNLFFPKTPSRIDLLAVRDIIGHSARSSDSSFSITITVALYGKLFARIDYTDSAGKRRSKEKRVRTKTEGRAVISDFVRELEDRGPDSFNAIGTTFNDFADHLEKHYLIPPEYVNGRKVAGKRSYKDDLGILKILRESFGRMELRGITWGRIERFRSLRLKTPTIRGEQLSVARVDRELSLLRHAFNIAIGERWLHVNPFRGPRPLINPADEVKRKRVLELEEENSDISR